jgi:hypothetical protein
MLLTWEPKFDSWWGYKVVTWHRTYIKNTDATIPRSSNGRAVVLHATDGSSILPWGTKLG